jgi:hypothetical protein
MDLSRYKPLNEVQRRESGEDIHGKGTIYEQIIQDEYSYYGAAVIRDSGDGLGQYEEETESKKIEGRAENLADVRASSMKPLCGASQDSNFGTGLLLSERAEAQQHIDSRVYRVDAHHGQQHSINPR